MAKDLVKKAIEAAAPDLERVETLRKEQTDNENRLKDLNQQLNRLVKKTAKGILKDEDIIGYRQEIEESEKVLIAGWVDGCHPLHLIAMFGDVPKVTRYAATVIGLIPVGPAGRGDRGRPPQSISTLKSVAKDLLHSNRPRGDTN